MTPGRHTPAHPRPAHPGSDRARDAAATRTASPGRDGISRGGGHRVRRLGLPALALLAVTLLFGGCGPLKLPDLPTPVDTPPAEVRAVRLVESSNQAGRYLIVVHLTNPNDFPLPMHHADYTLSVGSLTNRDSYLPAATIPAEGAITIELPIVLANGAPAGQYEVAGSIALRPEGEIREVFYNLGIPMPAAPFKQTGNIQIVSGAQATPPQPTRTNDTAEPPDETGSDADADNAADEPEPGDADGSESSAGDEDPQASESAAPDAGTGQENGSDADSSAEDDADAQPPDESASGPGGE